MKYFRKNLKQKHLLPPTFSSYISRNDNLYRTRKKLLLYLGWLLSSLQSSCVRVCRCVRTHAIACIWRWTENLRHQSSTSILFEPEFLVMCRPSNFQARPVLASHLILGSGVLGLQINTTAWTLCRLWGSRLCVASAVSPEPAQQPYPVKELSTS